MTLSAAYGKQNQADGQPFGDADYEHFKRQVTQKTGVRLDDYKPEQMRRRIESMAEKAGAASFSRYYKMLESRPKELDTFWDRITINVSELFRNPERFKDLKEKVLPDLIRNLPAGQPLHLWSAGCSIGAELYSLAILLDELGVRSRARLTATDLDAAILEKAKAGTYHRRDMLHVDADRRARYFIEQAEHYVVASSIKKEIEFKRHDLLAGSYKTNAYDLIACRNVVIYFTEEAKERVFRKFFQALKPGGVLLVGGTERIAQYRALGYELLLPYFYRKPAHLPILEIVKGGASSE